MKKIALITLFLNVFISGFTIAQQIEQSCCPMHTIEEPETTTKLMSCNTSTDICTGKYKPGKGVLKMLMVYIRFEDDNTSMSYWNSYPNPNNMFDVEGWMQLSLDVDETILSTNYMNMTNYFREVWNCYKKMDSKLSHRLLLQFMTTNYYE